VDHALAEALAPVLTDLAHSGAPVPEVRDRRWSDFPGQLTAMLHAADGTAQGVSVMADEPLAARVASVADQVQEWAVETLWRAGQPATWPECPRHPGSRAYAASKGAVEALTLILARELRGRDITANTVAPGPTATALYFEGKDQATIDRAAAFSPLERLGAPTDIAEVVAFLAGPGRWINGQTIFANGGAA
jgi:NAD(P)-dependent dehydrogenase (short-subunit alcohol dehydrogenase family)